MRCGISRSGAFPRMAISNITGSCSTEPWREKSSTI
nr:MAG TPA: hypothetical protein [Caudoviricetes sp.]